jgi:hypothetical protein
MQLNWAVETASTQTKPACAGFKMFDFPLVRVGGLSLYSGEFHSPSQVIGIPYDSGNLFLLLLTN